MKLIILLLLSVACYAQTYTEKYNTYNNRYEYFNSNNQMIGYKTYNSYTKTWEYYDTPQTTAVQSSVNVKLTQEVMAAKQARYDYNHKRINDAIAEARAITDGADIPPAQKQIIRDRFNKEYLPTLQKLNVDLSIAANAAGVIKWIWDGVYKILDEL